MLGIEKAKRLMLNAKSGSKNEMKDSVSRDTVRRMIQKIEDLRDNRIRLSDKKEVF